MVNLNFFIENGRNICENQQKLRVLCRLHIWEEKLTGASSQKQSWIPLHCSTWWKFKKIQLCTIMAEEELEIHLGTARAGPISLLMMPLLFLATAHHLVASGQWWPIASGKILCQTRARLHSLLVIKRATAASSSSLLGWGCKWELRNCDEFSLSSLQPVESGFMHNITFSFCANFVCLYI